MQYSKYELSTCCTEAWAAKGVKLEKHHTAKLVCDAEVVAGCWLMVAIRVLASLMYSMRNLKTSTKSLFLSGSEKVTGSEKVRRCVY